MRRTVWPLAAMAAAYAVLQLCYAVAHMDLGWDESVYLSQVDPRTPAAYFSAPRSRGISFLAAPVVALTASTTALRVTLVLLSSAALYGAFAVWRPLLGRGRTALAAALFAGLWITVLSGPEVMPNLWIALAAVAATGFFLRARGGAGSRSTEGRTLAGLAATLAAAALLRAPDAVWLALPLLLTCATVRAWRRLRVVAAALGGLAAGGAQWAVEAYVRFGGIARRLADSSDTEGGMGAHLGAGLTAARRSLNGPQLCRPCRIANPSVTHSLWWLLLPVLVAAACALALRKGRKERHGREERKDTRAAVLLPVACALSLAAPYLLLLDYSAPRFLLPAYALLALPVADLAARAPAAFRAGPRRWAVAAALCAVLAAHLSVQLKELRVNTADARDTAVRYQRAAEGLRRLGLSAPCTVTGPRAQPIAYAAGCASAQTMGNNRSTTDAALARTARRMPMAVLYDPADAYLPPYARTWHPHELRGTGWIAYVP